METTENHNQTMERIIKQAGGSIYTPPAEFGYSSIAILPKEVRLESLDQFLLAPRRTKASPQFETLESFAAYVNKHKVADTVIFVDVHGNATAYIDYHGPEKTTWNVHTARFNPRRSANFQTWSALCKKSGIGQRELATFIEDNIKDFLKPSGADMLEVAMNLNLTKNVVFKSDIKLRNGDVALEYVEETKGAGQLEIPDQFSISIPVLEGESPRTIEMRLRYALESGRILFSVSMIREQALNDEVKRAIYASISNDTKITPYLGNA